MLQLPRKNIFEVTLSNKKLYLAINRPIACRYCDANIVIHRTKTVTVAHLPVPYHSPLLLTVTVVTYRCKNSLTPHTFIEDGDLGIQQQTTKHFRHIVCQTALHNSYAHAATMFDLKKSTIYSWQKQLTN